jgi:hypothetical protein
MLLKSLLVLFLLAPLYHSFAFLPDYTLNFKHHSALEFASYPNFSLSEQPVDSFGGNWYAYQVDPEYFTAWQSSPALWSSAFNLRTSHWQLVGGASIKKDVEAQTHSNHNLILRGGELNLWVPDSAWASLDLDYFKAQVGRFIPRLDYIEPSVIYTPTQTLDALLLQLQGTKWRFDFLLSAWDPYLTGMPQGVHITPPEGSEAYAQRFHAGSNQRGRYYDAPYRTFVHHSISYTSSRFHLGITEQMMIGGKAPTWRDIHPFQIYHNNFSYGYTNVRTALHGSLFLDVWELGAEWNVDDMAYTPTEKHADPVEDALHFFVVWQRPTNLTQKLQVSAHYLETHRRLGEFDLPLLSFGHRRVIRSNYRLQEEPLFADTYLIDVPIGYIRGSGVRDLFFMLHWQQPKFTLKTQGGYFRKHYQNAFAYAATQRQWRLNHHLTYQLYPQVHIQTKLHYFYLLNTKKHQWFAGAGILWDL